MIVSGWAGPLSAGAQTVGKVGKSVPAAFRLPPGGTRLEARQLDPIVRNEALETGAKGGLLVTFADASELTLSANSSAVVDEFVYAGPGTGASAVTVAKGAFRFISGAMNEKNVKIETPTVTIGIRGSEIVGLEFVNGARLFIMRKGLARLLSKLTRDVADLPEGSAVAVSPDGRFSRVVQLATNRNSDGDPGELDALIDPSIFGEGFLPEIADDSGFMNVFLESLSAKRRAGGDDRYAFLSRAALLNYQLAYFLWEQGFFPSANDAADVAQSRVLGVMNRRTGAIGSLAGRQTRAARPGNRLNEVPAGVILADSGSTSESEWRVTVGDQRVNYAEGTSYGPITAPNGGTIYSLNTQPTGAGGPPSNFSALGELGINASSGFTPSSGGNTVVMVKDFQLGAGQRVFSIRGLANFVTTEFPRFVGTGFNDDARIRLILPSGDVFDIPQARLFGASVNASTFTAVEGLPPPLTGSNPNDGGGQTGWKDFLQRLRVAPGGTVRVEVTVRNVGDQAFQSTILLNNVQGSGAR
jgi:hypothetical protein